MAINDLRRDGVGAQQTGGVPSITKMTPPSTTGKKSWLGVDPRQRLNTATAKQGIEGYLGASLTPDQIQKAVQVSGYDDPTWAKEWTGEQYNRLLQAGAAATGGVFTPWSTTDTGGVDPAPPGGGPGTAPPPPVPDLPEYQRRADFAFTGDNLENDPGYQFRREEGQRALEHAAAARGAARGGNHMRDLIAFGQGLASEEFDRAYGRAGDTYDRNVGGDRYAHEAETQRQAGLFAPRFAGWERDRDEAWRQNELDFDREWQREVYGRDDSWRRHVYANDDLWRRYQLEEDRRRFLAGEGNN